MFAWVSGAPEARGAVATKLATSSRSYCFSVRDRGSPSVADDLALASLGAGGNAFTNLASERRGAGEC